MVGNMDGKAILDLDSEDTLLVANFCLCFLIVRWASERCISTLVLIIGDNYHLTGSRGLCEHTRSLHFEEAVSCTIITPLDKEADGGCRPNMAGIRRNNQAVSKPTAG